MVIERITGTWDFKRWRQEAGLSLVECQQLFDVSRQTAKNWETGKIKPPQAVFLCLQIFSSRLDFMGKGWHGFRLLPDCLEAPNGDFIYHYEVSAMRYLYAAAAVKREGLCKVLQTQTPWEQLHNRPPGSDPFVNVRLFRVK